MYILGISCYYHDAAAALLKDGILIAAAEEERFTRKKHDSSFPKQAIAFCLKKAGITSEQLNYVIFYEKPLLKFERLLLNSLSYVPKTLEFFTEAMKKWFLNQLWIKSQIVDELSISSDKLLFCEHHLSHAASSFYASSYQKAAILTVDGVGEWSTLAWGIGNGTKIELKEELVFPHSLGLLYSVFTAFCGFEVNEGEYKLMGLAPYGKPKYVKKIHQLLDVANDGSFALKLDHFAYQHSLKKIYTKEFVDMFGTANTPSDTVTQYYADIAASIQIVLEEILLKIVDHVYEKTHTKYLCYAGGVALNSSANWKLATKSKFTEIFIQPAAGDSGGALGAALWAYHAVLKKPRKYVMEHVYYGASETDEEIRQHLDKEKIPYKQVRNEDNLIDQVATAMAKGKVIGWVQGAFEWGPRALGNRSILADPRGKSMKDIVNSKIKFREGFRPFAPAVVSEKASLYFETRKKEKQASFEFMLYVVPVKKDKQKKLQAITHVDGTARPQFIKKSTNPLYHKLITAFGKKTGVPVVLNTSFNLKGEPIVNTSAEALSTFQRSGIDMLVLHNFIITKRR